MEKQCSQCLRVQPIEEFFRKYKNRDERHSNCRLCQRKYLSQSKLCDCGIYYTVWHRARHQRSLRHKKLMQIIIDRREILGIEF